MYENTMYVDAVDRFIDQEAIKYQRKEAGKSVVTDDKCDIELIAGDSVDFPPLKQADDNHLDIPAPAPEMEEPDEWPYEDTLEDDDDECEGPGCPVEEVEDEFDDEDEIFCDYDEDEEDLDEVEDEVEENDDDDDIELDDDNEEEY